MRFASWSESLYRPNRSASESEWAFECRYVTESHSRLGPQSEFPRGFASRSRSESGTAKRIA
jgi:hypothetical protein